MGVMKDDERIDELMGRALREVDPPPATPREAMWARIQAERAARANTGPTSATEANAGANGRASGVIELKPRTRRATWVPWGAAIAATLLMGIGLGRISTNVVRPGGSDIVSTTPQPADEIPTAYRLAATQHLERTETLLSSLAVDARVEGPAEMSAWASELLTDTRLLLSSPAAEDAATRSLLEDLELVLSQIAGIPEARAEQEVQLIQEGINQSDVLLRLHAATAGPRLVGT
jgi:hypothetical protein